MKRRFLALFDRFAGRLAKHVPKLQKTQEKLADARTFLASQQWERGAETMVRACQIASHDPIIREQAASELLQASKAALEKN